MSEGRGAQETAGTARVVWLDGAFLPEPHARIPATTTALLHGMALFETLRVVRGAAPLWERHRARLARGCAELDLPLPALHWPDLLSELCRRNASADGVVRITVGADFQLLQWRPLPAELERERRDGVALRSAEHARELPSLKTTSRAALLRLEREAGGEVLLLQRGALLETTRSNLFAHAPGRLWTAPADRVLPGVARAWVLERALERGLVLEETPPRLSEIGPITASRASDTTAGDHTAELFLSNAVRGIRPVAAIDGVVLGRPRGALIADLQREFDGLLERA